MSREYAYHRNQELRARVRRALADLDASLRSGRSAVGSSMAHSRCETRRRAACARCADLHAAGDGSAPRACDDHRPGRRCPSRVPSVRFRAASVDTALAPLTRPPLAIGGHHHHSGGSAAIPLLEPQPVLDAIQDEQSRRFSRWLLLWQVGRDELAGFGGELDSAVQMPGWTNVWTMPIQNRVDMLSTGVNTPIGVRVLGPQP